jgi:hypothetical protein
VCYNIITSFIRPNKLLMFVIDKHVVARKLFAAKDNIMVHVSNYYRCIKDLVPLNVESIYKHFLYLVTLAFIITMEL